MAGSELPIRSDPQRSPRTGPPSRGDGPANLADILERVLDKGIVIAGDIRINLLDIELLTIKLRLVVASVERAKEMGLDWWESDPSLSARAAHADRLTDETRALGERLDRLERILDLPSRGSQEATDARP